MGKADVRRLSGGDDSVISVPLKVVFSNPTYGTNANTGKYYYVGSQTLYTGNMKIPGGYYLASAHLDKIEATRFAQSGGYGGQPNFTCRANTYLSVTLSMDGCATSDNTFQFTFRLICVKGEAPNYVSETTHQTVVNVYGFPVTVTGIKY